MVDDTWKKYKLGVKTFSTEGFEKGIKKAKIH